MTKYEPLSEFLGRLQADYWRPTFMELERLLEGKLPPSARKSEAWWGNEAKTKSGHTHAWLDAGWRVQDVSFEKERVTFVRNGAAAPEPDAEHASEGVLGAAQALRERAGELSDWAAGRGQAAGAWVGSGRRAAADLAASGRQAAEAQLRERPLTVAGVSAGLAFGLGIALGYLLVRAGSEPAANMLSSAEERARRALGALAEGVGDLEEAIGDKIRRLRG
jgi:hypothetical protein